MYLHWLYQAGFGSWFDALGIHGLGYRWAPETMPMSAEGYTHPSFYFRRVEQMREIMVQYGDTDKQIWLTEFGWHTDTVNPTFAWYRVTEEEKGDYIVRAFRQAQERWAPWIGVMTLWTMPDPRWTPQQEQYYWAILEPDGTERASYRAAAGRLSERPAAAPLAKACAAEQRRLAGVDGRHVHGVQPPLARQRHQRDDAGRVPQPAC